MTFSTNYRVVDEKETSIGDDFIYSDNNYVRFVSDSIVLTREEVEKMAGGNLGCWSETA